MKEPKTQEEFEQLINKMVDIVNKNFNMLDGGILDLWDQCNRIAILIDENGYGPFYTEVRVVPDNKEFSDIYVQMKSENYMLLQLSNLVYSPTLILEELSYVCDEYMDLYRQVYKQ